MLDAESVYTLYRPMLKFRDRIGKEKMVSEHLHQQPIHSHGQIMTWKYIENKVYSNYRNIATATHLKDMLWGEII